MRVLLLVLCLLATPVVGTSDEARVEVDAGTGLVTLAAESAPLAQVLDALAARTRMQVVYVGDRPQTLVGANFDGVSEARAVFGLFEGLAINYVVTLDPTGEHVAMLMLLGAGEAGRASTPSTPVPVPDFTPVPEMLAGASGPIDVEGEADVRAPADSGVQLPAGPPGVEVPPFVVPPVPTGPVGPVDLNQGSVRPEGGGARRKGRRGLADQSRPGGS